MRRTLLLALLLTAATCAAQWQILDAHTTADLRGIDNVGHGIAWASGSDGTILRTEDGGLMWQLCAKPPGGEHIDFRGIQAFDNNTAIIMSSGKGDLSRLYKTTDGCQTWKLLFTNPDKDGFWDALQFDRRRSCSETSAFLCRGYLIGDPVDRRFSIFETGDFGEHWLRWEDSRGANVRHFSAKASRDEGLFAASNSSLTSPGINGPFAFVTGGAGGAYLFVAEPHSPFDNGISWKFSAIKLPIASSDSAGAFSIARRPTKRPYGELLPDLLIVGGDYQKPQQPGASVYVPFRADILNVLWRRMITPTTPPHGYRSAVAYDAATKTWITVGPNGTDISTDDGRNWRALHPDPKLDAPDADRNWNALSLPFAVGPHGRIGLLRPLTHPVK